MIYVDFEAITEKIQTVTPNNKSHTGSYQKHTDCGYGYKVVCCSDDKYTKPVQIYTGENAVYKFMEKMLEEVEYRQETKKEHLNKDIVMTKGEKKIP